MSEDIQQIQEGLEEPVAEYSQEEAEARARGWRPLEEWEGDPDSWYDYKEFNRRGELLDEISRHSQKSKRLEKEISDIKRVVEDLLEQNIKISKKQYKEAMDDLKGRKKEALSVLDTDSAVEIDEQMAELKEAYKKLEERPPREVAPQPDPEFLAWAEDNQWYANNIIMRGAADAAAQALVQENPALRDNPRALLSKVTAIITEEFPDKFQKKKKIGAVDGGGRGPAASKGHGKKWTKAHLNAEQLRMAEKFARTGVITVDEYAQQLGEAGILG